MAKFPSKLGLRTSLVFFLGLKYGQKYGSFLMLSTWSFMRMVGKRPRRLQKNLSFYFGSNFFESLFPTSRCTHFLPPKVEEKIKHLPTIENKHFGISLGICHFLPNIVFPLRLGNPQLRQKLNDWGTVPCSATGPQDCELADWDSFLQKLRMWLRSWFITRMHCLETICWRRFHTCIV